MSELSTPLLSVRSLKTYFTQDEGTVRAVDGVSFDLFPGVTLGVVGESGCGKSVTARSILRIAVPGKIVDGEIRFRPGARWRRAGWSIWRSWSRMERRCGRSAAARSR